MTWNPEDDYQEQLMPGKTYEGWIKSITKGVGYYEIQIETTGGARHKERRYLTSAKAIGFQRRFFAGLYHACDALPPAVPVEKFEDAADAHDRNLAGKHFKFVLKQKDDSIFFEISLTARVKDELTYRKVESKPAAAPARDPFADPGPGAEPDTTGDDIPF